MRVTLLALAFAAACANGEADAPVAAGETHRLRVYVVNGPLAEFAVQIGGEVVEVVFPVPPDVDPADWSPDAEGVAAFQSADLVLDQGAGYAAWLSRATLRRDRIVDTTAAVRDRMLPVQDAVTHRHGPGGAHAHAGLATGTWLDPSLAVAQAEAVAEAFSRARPEQAETFSRGLEALTATLRALEARLEQAAAHLAGQPILFSHPLYMYLERRYDLDARSLHWEPDETPSPQQWRELEQLRTEHAARLLVWERPPLPGTARRLEAMGIRSIVFDPGARAGGSTLESLRAGAEALAGIPGPPRELP